MWFIGKVYVDQIWLPLAAAVFFYLLLPLFGALRSRSLWRSFRSLIILSSHSTIYPAQPDPDDPSCVKLRYRFFGILEAVEDKDIIWLSDGSHRVRVDLSSIKVYVLPGNKLEDQEPGSENSPVVTRWANLGSLPEGTEFFVYGKLDTESLIPKFVNSPEAPLLVIIHDVPRQQFLSRAIRTGRQRNEYWNSISPFSFLSGVMVELLLILNLIQSGGDGIALFLVMPLALLPGLILAPPGIFFYFLYRNTWRKGRKYREDRDILRLPLRYANGRLPCGGQYLPQTYDGMPEEILLESELKFRHVLADSEADNLIWSYHAHNSSDPFAEPLYIKGNPEELALISQRKAQYREFLALAFFFTGLALNVLLFEILMLIFWF